MRRQISWEGVEPVGQFGVVGIVGLLKCLFPVSVDGVDDLVFACDDVVVRCVICGGEDVDGG